MKTILLFALLLVPMVSSAQVVAGARRSIRASGDADVAVRPDQARINVAVVTQAVTADEASQLNAARTAAVIAAVRQLIGNAGEVRTSSYNVSPVREGNPLRITGYSVTNSVQVIANNLAITGQIIDAAIAAGANRVDGISLGLRDDEPIKVQSVRAAGQIAKARAEAMAAGLGVRLGQLLHADQGTTGGIVIPQSTRLAATTTPIEPGSLTITGYVTVEYEIVP